MSVPVSIQRLALFSAAFMLMPATPSWAEERKPEKFPIRQALDIRYHDAHQRQRLDVFSPQGVENAPVVLFVHGGAWMMGDKNLFGFYRGVGRFLAEHGLVAVLINYRLSPAVQHPEHIKDVARAFAWTRRHIRDYGGDPDRLILCGHSAGGHLVSLLATDPTYLKDPALKLTDEDRAAIRGVISVSGVYRIPAPREFQAMTTEMFNGLKMKMGGPDGGKMLASTALALPLLFLQPIATVFGDDPVVCKQASPLTHVHKGLPPFLLLYAERDLPQLPEMAREFARALTNAGNQVKVQRIDGTDHNMILFSLSRLGDPTAKALLPFITAHTTPPAREKTP